ncbi:MAG: PmoA family protein, partial [bacterium]|nr:PmoA family protein [bacterium]
HPGAPNHDHHRSVWFAHAKLDGIDFWSENTEARVKQKHWLAYVDGDDECVMASQLGWYDANGQELMQQELVVALIPMPSGEHALEFQLTLTPGGNRTIVTLEKTNFGLMAVRVAKSISAHFGGGVISNGEGLNGEKDIFGKPARWMDYSGPVFVGQGPARKVVTEGITYFDHPTNPRYPTHWHVRDDGWMGASFGMHEQYIIEKEQSLVLRYLLHAHSGAYDAARASRVAEEFAKRGGFQVRKSTRSHRQFEVERK